MARYLTLSRAARLAGVKRGALQKKISDGELPTFEGMIELSDLLQAYPDAHVEDTAMLTHVEDIKSRAVPRSLRETSGPPDLETLSARALQLSEELAGTRAELEAYRALVADIQRKLDQLEHRQAEGTELDIAGFRAWLQRALAEYTQAPPRLRELEVRDTLLRIMAAHIQLFPSGHDYFVEGRDSLLEAGLRAGYALPYGCRDGSCGLCKARVVAGRVRQLDEHPFELAQRERELGYVLMCANTAVTDVEVQVDEAVDPGDLPHQRAYAQVERIESLGDEVRLLQLRTRRSARLRFLAGQYATLSSGGLRGAFAIANCPCEESSLHFHVQRRPEMAFNRLVFDELMAGDPVEIEGPAGQFVLAPDSTRPIVFIAWGMGFAPIKAMLENAVALEAAERIDLYWITEGDHEPYYHNLCRAWQDALDHFHYHRRRIDPGSARRREAVEAMLERIVDAHGEIAGYDYYIAAPDETRALTDGYLRSRGVPKAQLALEPIRQGEP